MRVRSSILGTGVRRGRLARASRLPFARTCESEGIKVFVWASPFASGLAFCSHCGSKAELWDGGRQSDRIPQITFSTNHDHRHVRSSRWSLRWNTVHHRKTFRQSRGVCLFIVHAFKTDPSRKTHSRAAVDQRGAALDKWPNCRRLWISLHKGFSRYCIPPLNRKISYKANLIMCPRI